MDSVSKCPECGCTQIGKGKLSGYANMTPVGRIFTTGSQVIADVCSNCGLIIKLKVDSPHKFTPKY